MDDITTILCSIRKERVEKMQNASPVHRRMQSIATFAGCRTPGEHFIDMRTVSTKEVVHRTIAPHP